MRHAILAGFVPACLGLTALLPTLRAERTDNIILGDFEGADYGEWVAEGKSFTPGPQEPVKLYLNRHGQRLAMSRTEFGGDSADGTLTSPPFVIDRRYLYFLLGGGNHPEETCVELVIDGTAVESQPGIESKALEPVFWDLSKYQGKTGQIRLVDRKQGQWGHIAADFFVLTDRMEEPTDTGGAQSSSSPTTPASAGEKILGDFRGESFGSWKIEGKAFGRGPQGKEGSARASSLLPDAKDGWEDRVGWLTSPEFQINEDYINFHIGGGDHAFRAAISLWVDGKVVRTTSGGGREDLAWQSWDVRDLKGRAAWIGVYDLCVDDKPGYVMLDLVEASAAAKGPVGGDVSKAIAQVRREAVEAIKGNAPVAASDPYRPVYHYAPPSQRMNDPNGPAWHDGWHHLFYQHMVFVGSGPAFDVHWGHARSRDLVNWETLPLAIYPSYELGERSCFSGNMAWDKKGEPVQFVTMVPYKKDSWRRVWAARPTDAEWINWEKSPANPPPGLVPQGDENRNIKDPFPFSAGDRRFLVLTDNTIALYEAEDDRLERWNYRGNIDEESAECPNFFEVDGHWIYLSSPHSPPRYRIGKFDPAAGKFQWETEGRLNHGGGFYATTAYRDDKGRTILHGVSRGQKPGRGWTGALALPRILQIGPDLRPRMFPVPELETLRGKVFTLPNTPLKLTDQSRVVEGLRGDTLEINARFRAGDAKAFGLRVRRSADGKGFLPVEWREGRFVVGKEDEKWPCQYEIDPQSKEVALRVFLDKGILDACTADGKVFESRIHYAPLENLGVEVFAEGGSAELLSLQAWEMKPATINHDALLSQK